MKSNIEISDMFKSVGYEFKLREMFREEKSLSDRRVNYEKRIAFMMFDRNRDVNLNEVASREFERDKILKKI